MIKLLFMNLQLLCVLLSANFAVLLVLASMFAYELDSVACCSMWCFACAN